MNTHVLLRKFKGKVIGPVRVVASGLASEHPDMRVPRGCEHHLWVQFYVGEPNGRPMLWTCSPDELVPL